jgi:hypothetical protein
VGLVLNSAGVTSKPDADGFYTYTRPEGKSGGHGVGWSEIPRYRQATGCLPRSTSPKALANPPERPPAAACSFRVPAGWEEVPVSIADLGGTEVGALQGPWRAAA